jgi:sulfoxide reductase heme-binding subunit YedZ
MMISAGKLPWNDKSGRFSALKAISLAGILLPGLLLVWRVASGSLGQGSVGPLGPRPITEAIHFTGDWAIRFLFLSLAITPLRRVLHYPKLILIRRQLGLAALFYALAHLLLYVLDQKGDLVRVATEIALRFYLTIGFVALLGLAALGVTSTDAMIRRLGKAWNKLHRTVYVIGVLAALHFFMQSKADVFEPTLMAGFFIFLMLWRLAQSRGYDTASPLVLAAIALASAVATAACEYAWYGIATNIPPDRVLAANLRFSYSIRPAWWVAFAGLGVAAIGLIRRFMQKETEPQRGRPAKASA